MTFSDSFTVLFHQANYIMGIDFHRTVQESAELVKFTSCENSLGVSVLWALWRIRGHKGQNSTETLYRGFLVLES